MQFTDEGYIINVRKHGETSLILTLITRAHGKLVGYVRGGHSKKNLGVYQPGNLIAVDAYARIEENMLSFRAELLRPTAVRFLGSSGKLSALSCFLRTGKCRMPEKAELERFYYLIDSFFNFIDEDNWIVRYSYFEFYLLDFLGIGLDLSECSATGTTENLAYVSPKTGRAVWCRGR